MLAFDNGVLTGIEADARKIDSLWGVEFFSGVLVPCVPAGPPPPGAVKLAEIGDAWARAAGSETGKAVEMPQPADAAKATLGSGMTLDAFLQTGVPATHPLPGIVAWADTLDVGQPYGMVLIDAVDWDRMALTAESTLRRIL